ncbi:MAG: 2-C-methyl-D-erythritol 2,4-cyclodiphosphate synthase [Treponema sp.]|nr:2-C-methyl-D-erythritol 2,4-cyclodiphosphate synthase [Treponema sp.]
MGTGKKKEYLPLGSSTVLAEGLKTFLKAAPFNLIIITVPENKEEEAKQALFCDPQVEDLLKASSSRLLLCQGSDTRQKSVFKALIAARENLTEEELSLNPLVLIHDGARPFVTKEIIQDTIAAVKEYKAAAPGITPSDTQKEVAPDMTITRHLVRSCLTAIQTPQGFLLNSLIKCHKKASQINKEYTDDTEIWDAFPELTGGSHVHLVKGNPCNIKITYPQDLKEKKMIRVGLGTDLHKLVEGRRLMIGGIEIPSTKGELGHSDGDVLLHAVTDALLGAAGMGDIGSYFPPEEAKWKDADSALLLKKVWDDIQKAGWSLGNLDCVIELESPKFLPWRSKVIESIAGILKTESCRVFVKAKTNEKLDSVGKGDAVKAYCTCLLEK